MPDNGSGVYSREYGSTGWVDDRNALTKITADRHDAHDQDIADALTARICRNGETTATARIPFAAGIGLSDGTVSAPAVNFTADTNSGIYRIGADNIGVALNGAKVLDIATTGLTVTGTFKSSSTLSPVTTDGAALGSTSLMWSDHFKASGHVDNWNNGDLTLTHTAGTLTLGGDGTTRFDVGTGDALSNVIVNGSGSGDGGGGYVAAYNNDANVISIANKSAILGGAYSATPYIYTGASGATAVEFSNGAVFNGAVSGVTTLAIGGALSGVTTLAASGLISANGGQIAFPASQSASADANTLDDYEEGTFTPALLFGGAQVDMTTSSAIGRYTKIGNKVLFLIYIVLTAKGSSTGNATISGLPFTSASSVLNPLASYFASVSAISQHPEPFVGAGATTVTMRHITSGTTASNMDDTNFGNASTVNIQGVYGV